MTESPRIPEAPRGLRRLAIGLVAATFVLLVAGGQVTSTESGDSVPTWPFPVVMEMSGGVTWELSHRHVAGIVGILTAALAAWAWIRRSSVDASIRRLATIAFGLVLFQAALGGVRVLVGAGDPNAGTPEESAAVRAIAITHACVAQVFLLLAVTMASKSAPRQPAVESAPGLRPAALATVAITYLQIVLGAVLRHTMTGAGLFLHVAGALAVTVSVALLASRAFNTVPGTELKSRRPQRLVIGLGGLLSAQILLGIASQILVSQGVTRTHAITFQAVIPTLHLVAGAGILALSWLVALSGKLSPAAKVERAARGAIGFQGAPS